MKISFRIVSFLLVISLILLTFLSIIKRNKRVIFHLKENLIIDTINRTVVFEGEIMKKEGEVQFLINLRGYEWLNKEASILSHLSLITLQNAFAFLDWVFWESLYIYRKLTKKISVSIVTQNKEIPAESLIFTKDTEISLFNLIFLGHPYLDNCGFKEDYAFCKNCPFWEEEKNFINKIFPQRYFLNTKYFPVDKKVKIKMVLSDK